MYFFNALLVCVLVSAGIGLTVASSTPSQKSPALAGFKEGYVTSSDGVRLYYRKVGTGPQIVILPGRMFLFDAFQVLAPGRTLVFYDMRNRGRSDAVQDLTKVGIEEDVRDLEEVRQRFKADQPDLVGFSYLGFVVMQYAREYPGHVRRIVQLGPVSYEFGKQYPPSLTAQDPKPVPDADEMKKLEELYQSGYARDHPREFCDKEWMLTRFMLVGNPANVDRLGPGLCAMPNEWPVHTYPHFQASMTSIGQIHWTREDLAKISVPLLTIHGTKDRNAPYGSGRDWDLMLPNARLVTIPGAAHMSWVEAPDIVLRSMDTFLKGKWPANAEKVTTLEVVRP